MAVGLALGAIGLATQIFGGMSAANAEAEARREQARLDYKKAEELLDRNQINNALLRRRADRHQGLQKVQIAASGRAQDATTAALIQETYDLVEEQIDRNTRAAEWEASAVRAGAESSFNAADNIETAGTITAIGRGLSGFANLYDKAPGAIQNKIGGFFGGIGAGVSSGLNTLGTGFNDAYRTLDWEMGISSGNYLVDVPLGRSV